MSIVNKNGLRLQNSYFNVAIPNNQNFTICVVMSIWMNRNFNLYFIRGSVLLRLLSFIKSSKELSLITSSQTTKFTVPSLFNGKKIVLWITENSCANVIKASLSNYASTLTQSSHTYYGSRNNFRMITEDGMFYKFMYSKNFYDFDSEQFHRVLHQEKLDGA